MIILVWTLLISMLSQQVGSFAPPQRLFYPIVRASFGIDAWRPRRTTILQMAGINLNSNDPFEILDLQLTPNLDKKQIKRAYKRLALKYHPDVVTNASSTPEEKRQAGDVFAKINWAYAKLIGKDSDANQVSSSTSSRSTSTRAAYEPPHRRTSTNYNYKSNEYKASPNASTDWRDYMPKYSDEESYDTGGDSFEKILSDILTGVAGASATGASILGVGAGGVVRDFVEFLERNVDGFSGNDDDAASDLTTLLSTGTLEQVGDEMDDTELVVQQLSNKLSNIDNELIMVQAELKTATKLSEKLDLSERVAELDARKKVVKGYIEKARKRLLSLQTRYKALIVGGMNDRRAGGKTSSSSYEASSFSRSDSSSGEFGDAASSAPRNQEEKTKNKGDDDSWKNQGFSSSGRRGSSRRRNSEKPFDNRQTSSSRQEPFYEASRARASSYIPKATSVQASAEQPTLESSYSSVPPHRRTSSFQSDDARRIREIKVDEEFEKLKKDLGL